MEPIALEVRNILLIVVFGPPLASLALMAITYLPICAGQTVDPTSTAIAFLFFVVPVGYVFGFLPALLAAISYRGALAAFGTPRPRLVYRACLGAACGGLAGGVWFWAVIGPDVYRYGLVAALVMALLKMRDDTKMA
jgi:hypothetical protein